MTHSNNSQPPSGKRKTIFRREYIQLLELLRQIREKRGLSQAELGMLLGQDQTFVSKYEKGIRRLDIMEMLDICHVLEIDILEILKELKKQNGNW
ncbi:helix-turn-helix transcriptional regulator [Crocosphaera sp. UHCC 0190]|uniref:helix-turn-helix domain-containing protein n=1 Tax=Crocosphaera sp. UHCC 0190 TaxID=3110246 RepID=UPI002B2151E7|nr:helix-turn-helix transcriptional regulator [Crocosphaera sp. UHCC 0190]MEA5508656.1 helix-turn-helix transcriptional regulator [Crocosphaera sp. UHCC 0190]